jgi:hypothetical protein
MHLLKLVGGFCPELVDRNGSWYDLVFESGYRVAFCTPEPWGNRNIVNRMGGFLPPGTMAPPWFFGICTAKRPWEGLQVRQNVAPVVPRLRHGVG